MDKKIKKVTKVTQEKNVIKSLVVDGEIKTKTEVIIDLLRVGEGVYFTWVDDKQGSEIYYKKSYLTTKPNEADRDNLDELS